MRVLPPSSSRLSSSPNYEGGERKEIQIYNLQESPVSIPHRHIYTTELFQHTQIVLRYVRNRCGKDGKLTEVVKWNGSFFLCC